MSPARDNHTGWVSRSASAASSVDCPGAPTTRHRRHSWGALPFQLVGPNLKCCSSHSPRATLRPANCDVRRIKLSGSTRNCTTRLSGTVLGGLRLGQMLCEQVRRDRGTRNPPKDDLSRLYMLMKSQKCNFKTPEFPQAPPFSCIHHGSVTLCLSRRSSKNRLSPAPSLEASSIQQNGSSVRISCGSSRTPPSQSRRTRTPQCPSPFRF